MIQRRHFLAAASTLLATRADLAFSQADYPSQPVKLLVPFSPGGTPDLLARVIGEQLGKQTGQGFVVDNRLGANGVIAAQAVAQAAPDGYTLLVTTGSQAINPSIFNKLPYDTVADFAPVSLFSVAPALVLVVNPKSPIRDFKEFLALARKPESNFTFGSPGTGNTLHLAGELLNATAGTHMLHIPYKGAAPALNAVMSGEVTACFLSTTAAVIAIDGKQVRPIAVTSQKRVATFADVPTMAESGVPDMNYNGGWIGLFAPAKTSPAIIAKLASEIQRAMKTPQVHDKMMSWETPPSTLSPQAFGTFFRGEMNSFARIVKLANIQKQ